MENTQPTLDLNDLNILREVVSQCATRGAFKAEEFSAIGRVYERLVAFLEASNALAATEEADSADQPAQTDEPVSEEVPVQTEAAEGI